MMRGNSNAKGREKRWDDEMGERENRGGLQEKREGETGGSLLWCDTIISEPAGVTRDGGISNVAVDVVADTDGHPPR